MSAVIDALGAAGMSEQAAKAKDGLFAAAAAAHRALAPAPAEPVSRWFVPGRIEVLGKHTDYAGGRSVLCAAERGFAVVASAREDDVLNVADALSGQRASLRADPDATLPPSGWTAFPATVLRRIARNFGTPLRGADMSFASDLPRAAGMSSSSALLTACFTVVASVNALESRDAYRQSIADLEALASYLGCVENGRGFGALAGETGVGTFGGSEDHAAILCSRAGQLSQVAFCPVRTERHVALPSAVTLVVASSGIAADKTGSARERYNRVSSLATAILAHWNRATGRDDATLAALNAEPGARSRLEAVLAGADDPRFAVAELLARVEQFAAETFDIIPRFVDAVAAADLDALGPLAERSQRLAESGLRNQVPETIALVGLARAAGAVASSAFGAGFGGSVWALVETERTGAFLAAWQRGYEKEHPAAASRAVFFATRPGPGMLRV